MSYIRLKTSDGETRWINMNRVNRVTLTKDEHNDPLLVILFDDTNDDLKIHGSDALNRQNIKYIVAQLDDLSGEWSCGLA